MRRQIIILCLLLLAVAPATAQVQGGTYPDAIWGDGPIAECVQYWVTPTEFRFTPWSMAQPRQPPSIGYVVDFCPVEEGLEVSFGPLISWRTTTINGPPAAYSTEKYFEFDEYCNCYSELILEGKGKFEAWIFFEDGGGRWETGCLSSTGSLGPWWETDTSCVWSTYDFHLFPEAPKAIRAGRHVGR
jgi:hypothetical protein